MDKIKAQISITTEFIKFAFVALLATSTAIGTLLVQQKTIVNVDRYLLLCYLIGTFVVLGMVIFIAYLLKLINKLDSEV